jgi:hypothetical protein
MLGDATVSRHWIRISTLSDVTEDCTTFNPLTYGGGLIGPPLFQRLRSLIVLKCQKFEKISIPLLGSLLCESILFLLQ